MIELKGTEKDLAVGMLHSGEAQAAAMAAKEVVQQDWRVGLQVVRKLQREKPRRSIGILRAACLGRRSKGGKRRHRHVAAATKIRSAIVALEQMPKTTNTRWNWVSFEKEDEIYGLHHEFEHWVEYDFLKLDLLAYRYRSTIQTLYPLVVGSLSSSWVDYLDIVTSIHSFKCALHEHKP